MRRLVASTLLAFGSLGLTACGEENLSDSVPPPEVPEGHAALTIHDAGLRSPQSILHEPGEDLYLVSNAGQDGQGARGSGFISRIAPDGEVEELRWIEDGRDGAVLADPGGMALHGDTLYVSDGDCVRLFHRVSGSPAGSLCPSGELRFNDVAVDREGRVFATGSLPAGDSASWTQAAVIRFDGGGASEVLLSGAELGGARGIATSRRGIFFTALESGTVAQVTPDGPRRVLRGREWRLQGIVFAPDGSFAFSNVADSTVLYVRASRGGSRGEVFTLVSGIPSPGDLGFDSRRDRVLIPQPVLNRLFFVDLSPGEGDEQRR